MNTPIPVCELSTLPTRVRHLHAILTARRIPVTLSKDGAAITVTVEKHGLVLTVTFAGRRAALRKVSLVKDGEPVDVAGLTRAFQLMLGAGTPAALSGPITGTSQAARSNSVTVRRTTVIRV